IVDPHFIARNELIDVLVSALGEFDVVEAANQASFYEPHVDTVGQRFPEAVMDCVRVGRSLATLHLSQVAGADALLPLVSVRSSTRRFRICALLTRAIL